MAEFNIKRRDSFNSNSQKDRQGCYKRGDIINIQPDGNYEGMVHLTVLKVPGLKVENVKFYQSSLEKPKKILTAMTKIEMEDLQKANFRNVNIPYKAETINFLGNSEFVSKPVFKGMTSLVTKGRDHLVEIEVMDVDIRRRFQIPPDEMDKLFPGSVTEAVLNIGEWNKLKLKIRDKKNGN